MAEDTAAPSRDVGQALVVAIAAGAAATAVLFFLALGIRGDALLSLGSMHFVFKFVVTLCLAATAALVVLRMSQPGRPGNMGLLALAPGLLAIAAAAELVVLPEASWRAATFGTTWWWCLIWIPLLSLAPLLAILAALKHGAPTAPGWTGAVAGMLAGGIGATFYATHCPADSPLFLLAWYSAGVLLLSLVGALAGRRMLRW